LRHFFLELNSPPPTKLFLCLFVAIAVSVNIGTVCQAAGKSGGGPPPVLRNSRFFTA
jgi:hypothetical protein